MVCLVLSTPLSEVGLPGLLYPAVLGGSMLSATIKDRRAFIQHGIIGRIK